MKREFLQLRTKYNNNYLYCTSNNKIILLHPLINFFLNSDTYIEDIIFKLKINNVKIKDLSININGKYSKNDIFYYYNKYLLLKKNNYFNKTEISNSVQGRIDRKNFNYYFANTQQICFEVTNKCNLDCYYCCYGKLYNGYHKRENINLSIPKGKKIIDFFSNFWDAPLNKSNNKQIDIGFYGGEPLLNFKFIKNIVIYIKNELSPRLKRVSFSFSMTTNGILLDKYIDFFIENDFNILISLDGDLYNNFYRTFPNGNSSYEKTYKNLKIIQENHKEYFNNHIHFNAVLHDKNTLIDVCKYFTKEFDQIPSISELNSSGINNNYNKEFQKIFKSRQKGLKDIQDQNISEKMSKLLPQNQLLYSLIKKFNHYYVNQYCDLLSDMNFSKMPTSTCLPFGKKIFILANGEIMNCERINQKYQFGMIDKNNNINIYKNHIEKTYNDLYDDLKKQCETCFNFDFCQQCIFHFHTKNDKTCDQFMNKENFAMFLADNLNFFEENPKLYSKLIKEMNYEA